MERVMAFELYKKGQGYYTRLGTAIGSGIIVALGCYSLFKKLDAITIGEVITPGIKTWIQAGVPTLLFLILGWLVFKLINAPRCADFMIATEGEMKKVSWTTRKEIITSTKVVIITVIIMAILLALVDVGFQFLFRTLGVLIELKEGAGG
jgi:preprotein translocase subunit SecE